MSKLLLIVIYLAFIGLGIPDSIFGAAWPVMHLDFNVGVDTLGAVTVISCLCGIVSSLLSARLIKRFGIGAVTAVSTLLTCFSLLAYSFSESYIAFCLLTIPAGLGAGAIDAGLNNYVAVNLKASHMSFLHCFYGVGVTVSPFFMALALGENNDWRNGYRYAFIAQLIITLAVFLAIPLWNKAGKSKTEEKKEIKTLSFKELFRLKSLKPVLLTFVACCSVECTLGAWGGTFLNSARGFSPDAAAAGVTLFFAGLASGRFLSGVLSSKLSSLKIIFLGLSVCGAGLVLMCIPFEITSLAGLFLGGLGIGPVYPNVMHLTPRIFGEENSQSVMGTQQAAAYCGVLFMPALYGSIVKQVGAFTLPIFTAVWLFITLAAVYKVSRNLV